MTSFRGDATEWNVVHDETHPLEEFGKTVPTDLRECADALKKAEDWRTVTMSVVRRLDDEHAETEACHAIVAQ